MAVSRHLGYYRTANSAIRSADPENPSLGAIMEWIRCTGCEIFAFKLYFDLEPGVRGHSRSSKVALFDTAHTTLCSFFTVNMRQSITIPRYSCSCILVENRYPPLYLASPLVRFTQQPLITKNKSRTDRRRDGIGVAYTRYSICCRA